MRAAVVPAALIFLGCSSSGPGTTGRDAGLLDAGRPIDAATDGLAAADASDGGPEAEAGDLPPALTWTPVQGNFVEGDLVSVWGTSPTAVYVGTDAKSVYYVTKGVAYWTGMADAIAGAGWGSDPQTVYAVGASAWLSQAGKASNGNLFRFTGGVEGTWVPAASGPFYAVWGSSPSDVYAVGEPGIVHASDGRSFANEPLGSGTGAVLSVFGSGPNDVYAGTSIPSQTVVHSAGDGTWQTAYAENGSEAWAVWAGAPGNAYAIVVPVGTQNPPAHIAHEKAGQGWTKESVGDGTLTLVALWGSADGDVYAGGWHMTNAGKSGDLFHTSGDGVWVPVPLPGKPYDVRAIWGTSASDVYVAIYDVEDGPVLLHGQP